MPRSRVTGRFKPIDWPRAKRSQPRPTLAARQQVWANAPKLEVNGELCGVIVITDATAHFTPYRLIRSQANRFAQLYVSHSHEDRNDLLVTEPTNPGTVLATLRLVEGELRQVGLEQSYAEAAEQFQAVEAAFIENAAPLFLRQIAQRKLSRASFAEVNNATSRN